MGRVRFSDSDKYGGGSGGSYFSLKNDKDVAKVRFMINNAEDMDNYTFACHKVQVGDNYKQVSCLREYNEPVNKCPFCDAYSNAQIRYFLPLYNIDEDKVQIWERGRTWAGKLSSLISRYGSKSPLVNHIFEIERNGVKGDMKTTYEPYEIEKDDTTLRDLPPIPEILGNTYLLDKSFDDMEYYVETEEFPPEEDEEPIRRRGSDNDDYMNPPEDTDDEEIPFKKEEESTQRRARTDRGVANNSRRTPASSNSDRVRRSRRDF